MTAIPVTIQERIPLPPSMPARPAAAAATAGLTPAEILRILRQRMFMILTLWILITAVAVGTTWYLDRNYSEYKAKGYVQVESPFPKRPMDMNEQSVPGELMNRYVADQAVLMKDDKVLQNVLTDSDVIATQWYASEPDKTLILDHFREQISVTPNTGTSYLTIQFSARKPEDSAIIVNTLIAKYMQSIQERSQLDAKSELQDYLVKEKDFKDRLAKLQEEKKKFMAEQSNSPGMGNGVDVVGETLRAVAITVNQIEQQTIEAKAQYDNYRGTDANQIVLSPQMNMMIQQDPRISSLQNNKTMLEQAKTIALSQLGPNHRSVKDYQDRIDAIDQDLQKAILLKEKEVREYQIDVAYNTYQNAMQALLKMKESKLEQKTKVRDQDQARVQFQNMEVQEMQLTKDIDKIREFSNQLDLMIKGGMVRVRPSLAIKPTQKSFPPWSLFLPGGSILGLLLGVGLALLLELMDTTMRTPRDIIRYAHVPILGTVPDLDDEEIPIDQIELASHSAPRSMTAESFRSIRTNLLLSSPAERQRTVLVTSARPEEGKTAIACNLAVCIGQSGRRVLLVDANFHRPVLHQIFNRPQREGLSNALIGQASLDTLIQHTDLPNVDIITSGPIPPNPTELLSGHYLRDLIGEAATRYDQIIFDGPPILLLSDSLVLAGMLDGVIIVCRAKATSRGAVQRAREQIERVNGRIFGAILNAARVSRGGYFREQIRSYYDYQPEEVLAGTSSKALPSKSNADDDQKS